MSGTDILDSPIPEMLAWNLKVKNNVQKIYESTESIPSENDKRIKFIMDKLMSGKDSLNDRVPAIKRPGKNASIAINHRNRGDERYKSNDKITALINYTQAISYATQNSTLVATTLDSRSKCLYEFGMFYACTKDIERIVPDSLPINLKADLFYRKSMCHRAIACKLVFPALENPEATSDLEKKKFNQIVEDYNKLNGIPFDKSNEVQYALPPVFVLKDKNSLIPGLSNAFEINYTEKDGRHIRASRKIKPGELVGVCKPYVSVVNFSDRYNFCWYCTKQIWNGIPCEWCSCTVYCNEICRELAFKKYHEIECFVLPRLCAYGFDQDILMTLRAVTKAYKECECKIDDLLNTFGVNDKTPTKDQMYKNVYEPNNFSSFHNLWSEFQPDLHDTNSYIFAKSLVIAYHLGIGIGFFKEDASLNDLKNHDKFMGLLGFVERTMRIVKFNQFNHEIFSKHFDKNVITSSTVNPSYSLFNHQCTSNVVRIRRGKYEYLFTISPIEKGAEVYSNYYKNDFTKIATKDRKDYLLSTFGIDCKCVACTGDGILKTDATTEDSKVIKQDLEKLGKQIKVLNNLASDYYCKNNKMNDVSSYAERTMKTIESCYEHLELNSADLVNSKLYLCQLFQLTQIPLIFPK